MFDASGWVVTHGGGGTTLSRAMPADIVSALTRLPRRRLRELTTLGVLEPVAVDGERHPRYVGDPARAAAAHELLLTLGAAPEVAIALSRPDLLPPDDGHLDLVHAGAALARLLHGSGGLGAAISGNAEPTLSLMPAHHLVRVRARCSGADHAATVTAAHAELMAFTRRHEMTVTGPMTVQVTNVAEAELGIQVSVSVEELVGSSGHIEPGYRTAEEVASLVHDGDPRSVATTGERLWRWVLVQDLTPAGFPLELHTADGAIVLCWPVG